MTGWASIAAINRKTWQGWGEVSNSARRFRYSSSETQNRHFRSRLLLTSSSRLRELHDPNESAQVVGDETRRQRCPRQTKQAALRKLGWRSIVVWECQTEKSKSLEKFGRRLRLSGASRAGKFF